MTEAQTFTIDQPCPRLDPDGLPDDETCRIAEALTITGSRRGSFFCYTHCRVVGTVTTPRVPGDPA